MSLRSLALVFFTGFLFAVYGPSLLAQKGAGKQTAVDKEERTGLRITNNSTEPWYVGVDSITESNATIESMKLKKNGKDLDTDGKLGKGSELLINPKGFVILNPVPPVKGIGPDETGVDFSAKLYLKDSKKGKLAFTMYRVSGGAPRAITCTLDFPGDMESKRFQEVFQLTPGEGAFEGKYVSPLYITAKRLPEETELEKAERKGLKIDNTSKNDWYVGLDSNGELNGAIEIMKLSKNGKKYDTVGKLEKGKELTVPAENHVLISPVPPKKWRGLAKTGVDFSAQLYLRDFKHGKLYFTMDRASQGETEAKTCTISFPAGFDSSRFEEVLLWTLGEGAFAGKYGSPLSITGDRLPPPKGKTRQDDN